jgi:hypothetical protein
LAGFSACAGHTHPLVSGNCTLQCIPDVCLNGLFGLQAKVLNLPSDHLGAGKIGESRSIADRKIELDSNLKTAVALGKHIF